METIPALRRLPLSLREQSGFPGLVETVSGICAHPALRFEQGSLDTMIQASLLFTICFYRNLHAVLEHTVRAMAPGMELRSERLLLVMTLAQGELTDRVHLDELSPYGPHYVWMLRAAKQAGVETAPIERFVELLNAGCPVVQACEQVGFSKAVTEYFTYSTVCCSTYIDSFATIAGREHVLAETFETMVRHLPVSARLSGYREFLEGHVVADRDALTDAHGDIVTRLVELLGLADLPHVVAVMGEFFTRRLAVYDCCLTADGLFLTKGA